MVLILFINTINIYIKPLRVGDVVYKVYKPILLLSILAIPDEDKPNCLVVSVREAPSQTNSKHNL